MVETTYDGNYEEEEDYDPAIHPVYENKDENRRSAYSPELPEEEGEKATEGLSRCEPHVAVRGEHGCGHGVGLVEVEGGREGEGGREREGEAAK